jgi:hypothetical protein
MKIFNGHRKAGKSAMRFVAGATVATFLLGVTEPNAWAVLTDVCPLEPAGANLEAAANSASGMCTAYAPAAGVTGNPEVYANCHMCEMAIQEESKTLNPMLHEACIQSNSADAEGVAAAKAAAAANSDGSAGFLTDAGSMGNKAMSTLGLKQSATAQFAAAAQKCEAALNSCNASVVSGLGPAKSALAACHTMASSSAGLAATVAEGATGLGDVAKYAMAGAALLGVGAMAYSLLNKNNSGASNSAYDPALYPTGPSASNLSGTAPTPTSTNDSGTNTTGSSQQVAGTSLGSTKNMATAPNGAGFVAATPNAGSGNASTAAQEQGSGSSTGSGGGPGFMAMGAQGSKAANGTFVPSGGGAGGAGDAGAANGTGASSAGEYAMAGNGASGGAGTDAGAFDMGASGASKGQAMLGMKSSGDIKELDGALGAGSTFSPVGADGNLATGDRTLASEGAAAQKGEEGSTLFHMVRSRYKELKKSGHI